MFGICLSCLEEGDDRTKKKKTKKKAKKRTWIDVELAKHASAIVGMCAEDLSWKLCTSSETKLCKIKWITYTGQGADENVLSHFAFPRKATRVMINRFPGKDRLLIASLGWKCTIHL
jgi:hypothetical protein